MTAVAEQVVPPLLVGLKAMLVVLVPVFFVSGLDDFFVDAFYAVRSLYRRLFVLPRIDTMTVEDLREPPEQPAALMIPAWDESAVIEDMLHNTLRTLDYGEYHVFVGTYPNDPDTAEAVDAVAADSGRVHRVTVPHDGPTNKADCLNAIHEGIRAFEADRGVAFQIFAMFDAEDVIHPLSLRAFNYLIPRKDMVQLPVLPLESAPLDLTGGHYMDEFAEAHQKDLVVREFLAEAVPSAGTGCAFSRVVMDELSRDEEEGFFDTSQLTEDYEVGLRLGDAGFEGIFLKHPVPRREEADGEEAAAGEGSGTDPEARRWWTAGRSDQEYIATREFFPRSFSDAVRQKSRWVLGIAFQGWQSLGWPDSLRQCYMLFRDRKVLVTNVANVLGYVVVAGVLASWGLRAVGPEGYRYPALVEPGSWLAYLLMAVVFFLVWRVVARMFWVGRAYGLMHGLLSAPRLVWSNVINFASTLRATGQYLRHLATGEAIAWEATDHRFPTEEELRPFRRRLGNMLVRRQLITEEQLGEALEQQERDGRRLGEVLLDRGWVNEGEMIEVLGVQMGLETEEIDPYETPLELLGLVPRSVAVRHSVYPVGRSDGGRLTLATDDVPSREKRARLQDELGLDVELRLSVRTDIAFAIRRGYGRLRDGDRAAADGRRLGRRLVESGDLTEERLREALREQRRSYEQLGTILLRRGSLSRDELQGAVEEWSRKEEEDRGQLGAFLVERGLIERSELESALADQRRGFSRLGEVLVEKGWLAEERLREALDAAE